ncbi:S8 family serine peptidase [Pseudarthrobacter psychrotolerans]|uniref:S8 family serine peptidase n=1 Tax=Pseudarthrobacter psychrotolerans TaxID=2697569 RepID=A0A6P1NRW4_9MICC|nr:S8 family serine peptidase [Pseudarthrobacter psychrotolerans]QHK21833.1 S8 family serine peptidase [Pseudarthrobacter psychrotolerans]
MKKTVIAGFAALMMGLGAITFAGPGNAAPEPSHIAGQIMVKFRDDGAAAGVLRRHGLSDGPGIGSTGAHLIKVPDGKELQLVEALRRNPNVEYAEPDLVVTAATNDQYFPSQYALQNTGQAIYNTADKLVMAVGTPDADVDAVEAWNVTMGTNVRVAVLDSGVASDNPDINPKVVDRANFSSSATRGKDPVAEDYYGHGTHVAGIVAAAADNTIGVAGVCPGCTILAGKVLSDNGMGSSSGLANGINWAVSKNAKVINMSLAVGASATLETAVNNAWNAGVVLVAAAGNGGNQDKFYPGAYPNVIAVGATDNNDAKASFSTYGASWVDVAAPGVNVYSTFPNHRFAIASQYNRSQGYDVGSGTSMASPIVAAVAALAWSSHTGATNASVRANVETTAEKITGQDSYWAYGRVNACKAVGGCP